jgi:organic radical activating enzyme
MTVKEIMKEMAEVGYTGFVCVTGGEPLTQDIQLLVNTLRIEENQYISVETNGSQSLVPNCRMVCAQKMVVDCKGPSSFKTPKLKWDYDARFSKVVDELRTRQNYPEFHDEIKFVIADRKDYDSAKAWLKYIATKLRYIEKEGCFIPNILFSPVIVKGKDRKIVRKLAEWMVADIDNKELTPKYQLQLHKYIWPEVKRGV